MWEIKNIYTENMFFKEQLMRPGGLAVKWRISNEKHWAMGILKWEQDKSSSGQKFE